MQATRPSPARYYRPELDVVRFLAFVMVFLHHTLPSAKDPRVIHLLGPFVDAFDAFTEACGFGLSLFFTLSAFLICELLLRERDSKGKIEIKQFYIRRLLRIWPLYYLGLALGVVVAFLPGGHPSDLAKMSWFIVFLGAWQVVLHGTLNNPVNPLWSISVEEQFYLFAPWSVKYLNRRSLYGFCIALLIFANAWLYLLGRLTATDVAIWFNSFVQYECFAGGILLCLLLRGRLPRLVFWQRSVFLVFSASCLFLACYGLHARFGTLGEKNPGSWALIGGYALATIGCSFVLVAFLGTDSRFFPGWAVYLGRISFGLYVFHSFASYIMENVLLHYAAMLRSPAVKPYQGPIYLLDMVLRLGLTILLAALSYRFFETPFLKMKKRHAVIESEPILVGD